MKFELGKVIAPQPITVVPLDEGWNGSAKASARKNPEERILLKNGLLPDHLIDITFHRQEVADFGRGVFIFPAGVESWDKFPHSKGGGSSSSSTAIKFRQVFKRTKLHQVTILFLSGHVFERKKLCQVNE